MLPTPRNSPLVVQIPRPPWPPYSHSCYTQDSSNLTTNTKAVTAFIALLPMYLHIFAMFWLMASNNLSLAKFHQLILTLVYNSSKKATIQITCANWNYVCELSLSDSFIPSSRGVKRQASWGEGGQHTQLQTFSLKFQKHCLVTHRTLQFLWNNSISNKRKL